MKFKSIIILILSASITHAASKCEDPSIVISCKPKLSCSLVRSKLTKEELSCFPQKTKVRTIIKTVVVEKPVEKIVYVEKASEKPVMVNQINITERSPAREKHVEESRNKNNISILGLATPTGLKVNNENGVYKANTYYQLDVGLMYQRDLSESIRGSLGFTIKGNAILGLGYNF